MIRGLLNGEWTPQVDRSRCFHNFAQVIMAKVLNELKDFQCIPRMLIFDNTISDRARFVYCFMAAKPDNWDFLLEPMSIELGYSIDTLRKYIKELIDNGWLVKGEQNNENGKFGAVDYIIKASKVLPSMKNTDTENFRHGKTPTQHIIDNINIQDCKENKEKEILKEKSKSLFEECWVAYRRKGSKKKSRDYWDKLTDKEKDKVMPHIKAYVSSREMVYQKDFERYLRDKTFNDVVLKGSVTIFDPTIGETNEYHPFTDGEIQWNEYYKAYVYVGMDMRWIPDGYTDDNRPNGATIMLNNGRGTIFWDTATKTWNKK